MDNQDLYLSLFFCIVGFFIGGTLAMLIFGFCKMLKKSWRAADKNDAE